MGRKALDKNRTLNPSVRKEWLDQLVPFFIEKGLTGVRVDDVTRFLGISKATFYEHFSSRDELYSMVVDHVLEQILSARLTLKRSDISFQERYILLCGLILQQVSGISPAFLADIKNNFPALWQKILDFFKLWETELTDFFAEGINAKAFARVNPAVLSYMMLIFLRELMSPEYLMANKMSLQEAFLEFFRIQATGFIKFEGFSPDLMEEKTKQSLGIALTAIREAAQEG